MVLVLVAVGDHGAATVPAPPADDVEGPGAHGVRRADDRADVEVVAPVLDGDVEVVTPACRGRRRSRRVASSGTRRRRCAGHRARAARGPSGRRPATGPPTGPTPTTAVGSCGVSPPSGDATGPLPAHSGVTSDARKTNDRATGRTTQPHGQVATGDLRCDPRPRRPARPLGDRHEHRSRRHPPRAPDPDARDPRVDGGRGLGHQGAGGSLGTGAEERQGHRPLPDSRPALGPAAAQDDGRRVSLGRDGLPRRRGRLVGGVGARPDRAEPELCPRRPGPGRRRLHGALRDHPRAAPHRARAVRAPGRPRPGARRERSGDQPRAERSGRHGR